MCDPSKYRIQRFVFTSLGSFLFPWHRSVAVGYPAIVLLYSLLLVIAALQFALHAKRDRRLLQCAAFAAWMLIATAPAFTLLFVAPDLEGSRYVYAASAGWAILLSILLDGASALRGHTLRPLVASGLAGALVLCSVSGVWWHQRPWQQAAALRDAVLSRVADLRTLAPQCATVALVDVPETVDGAFVLRNGLQRAAAPAQVAVSTVDVQGCRFGWRNGTFTRAE